MDNSLFQNNNLRRQVRANDFFGYGMFILMLYPMATTSLARYLVPIALSRLVMLGAVVFAWMLTRRHPAIRGTYGMLLAVVVVGVVVLYGNADISHREYGQVYAMVCILLIVMALYRRRDWWVYFWKVAAGYMLIHLFFGYFFMVNRGLQLNYFVPLLRLDRRVQAQLVSNINKGFMTGLAEHYSSMGMYMSLGVIAYAGVFCSLGTVKSTRRKWIFLAAFALGLVLTGKRGPTLFAAASILFVYWLVNRPFTMKQYLRTFGIGLLVAAVLVAAFMTVPQMRNVVQRYMSSEKEDVTSGRGEFFWIYCLDMIQKKPLTGWGWRSFRYRLVGEYRQDAMNDAHDIYLQLLAETGAVGLVIFLIFFAACLYVTIRAVKLQKKYKALSDEEWLCVQSALCFQLYTLLYGITGNPLYDSRCYIPYYFCCGIGYSAFYNLRKYEKNLAAKQKQESLLQRAPL